LAILITPNIIARAFSGNIHREEAERRWYIQRTETKQIYEFQRRGGMKYTEYKTVTKT